MNTLRPAAALIPLLLLLSLAGCATPSQHNEPDASNPQDSSAGDTQTADLTPIDGDEQDVKTFDVGAADVTVKDALSGDSVAMDSAAGHDTAATDTADIDLSVGTCPKGPPATCDVVFEVKPTTPVKQDYVALSGDFLIPAWPSTTVKGAKALVFDSGTNTWRVTLQLPHGRVVAYKYIAGWPDNPGPVWFNQAGKFEGAANSIRVVDCAATVCGQTSSRAALVAATLQAHGEDVRDSQGLIGLGVGVVVDGEIAALGGFGQADKEKGIAVDPLQTRFRWASVTKTVVGALAAKLAVAKQLNLDSDATAALPTFPAPKTYAVKCKTGTKSWYGKSYSCVDGWFSLPLSVIPPGEAVVSYRRLLGHLAGVVHYSNGPADPTPPASKTADPKVNTGPTWALSYLKDQPLIAVPGTAYNYSSFGFNLVGAAIGASQQSTMEALAQQAFWAPLQLKSVIPDREWEPIPHRAKGYWKGNDGTILPQGSTDVSWKLPGGGYVSTIADLAGWCRGLAGEQVLSSDAKQLAWSAQKTNAGKSTGYGLGFFRGSSGGKLVVGHSGSQQKVRSNLRLFPDEKLCVVLATNSSWASVSKLHSRLLGLIRTSLEAAAQP